MTPSLKMWEGPCVYGWKEMTTVNAPPKEVHMNMQEKTRQSKIASSFTKSSIASSNIHSYSFESLTTFSQEHLKHSDKNQHKSFSHSQTNNQVLPCFVWLCNLPLSMRFELYLLFFQHWQDFLRIARICCTDTDKLQQPVGCTDVSLKVKHNKKEGGRERKPSLFKQLDVQT